MAIREGKWKCGYCAVVNRGADLACHGCGASRDKDVSFFLEDDSAEVQDPELLKRAEAGADWLCRFCQTSNRPERTACVHCGAEKGTSPSRVAHDVPPVVRPAPPPAPSAAKRGLGLGCALVLLVFTAFCSLFLYRSLRKTDETLTVAGFEWTRTIAVEAFRAQRETAWEGETPAGARLISRSREVHHTEHEQVGTRQEKVGTRDMGNGFFKDVYEQRPVYRDRPVYRNRVTYDVDRWVVDRTARASGTDQDPRWPDPGLHSGQREGSRHEDLIVLLHGSKDYRMALPLDRWSALRTGETHHAVIQGGSRVISIQ